MTNDEIQTPRGPITLRRITADDGAAFRVLRLAALQNKPEAFGASYEESSQQPPEHWSERAAQNASGDTNAIFVAEAEGRLVAMVGIKREQGLKVKHYATIWGVFVDPAWRGLHLTEQLIERCCRWGKEQGVRHVDLMTATVNTPAIAVYARCGFRIVGQQPEVIFHDGRYYDELIMVRRLAD